MTVATSATSGWTAQAVEVAGGRVELLKGGTGRPLVVFHRDAGNPGWLPFYEQLAQTHTVYVPSHPGFGKSDRPDWARNVRDLAALYQWLFQELGLSAVTGLGLGFGGWVAAELATFCPHALEKLVLVAPMGIKPRTGEIVDQFLLHAADYVRTGFHDPAKFAALYGAEPDLDQLETWEINREMTTRLAWKPYMYNAALPVLLRGVRRPALVVWGDDDRIVPRACGLQYVEALPNARLEIVADAGHFVEVEQPAALARLTRDFITTS